MEKKATKAEAHYRDGTTAQHCSICTMYVPNRNVTGTCTAVKGPIAAGKVCDYFRRKHGR